MIKSSGAYVRRPKERAELSIEGTIVSFTKVYELIGGFNREMPFVLALIKLNDGGKVVGEVSGSNDIKKGDIVESHYRRIYTDGEGGLINYGIKWVIK